VGDAERGGWRVVFQSDTSKKRFVVTTDNRFLVPVRATDTICVIQKIKHLWCQSVLTDTKNLNFGVGCLCQPVQKINFQK
jgi:hypothetical protein